MHWAVCSAVHPSVPEDGVAVPQRGSAMLAMLAQWGRRGPESPREGGKGANTLYDSCSVNNVKRLFASVVFPWLRGCRPGAGHLGAAASWHGSTEQNPRARKGTSLIKMPLAHSVPVLMAC